MRKKLLSALCLFLVVSALSGMCAFASPYSVSPWETGNSDSLLYIKKPASLSATTSESTYTVSASGRPGAEVTVYRRSIYDGEFYRVFQGGYMLEGTIGSSGVYVVSIELVEGGNKMLIRAQNDWEVQLIKIDITRLSQSQLERLNGLSVGDLFNAY